MTVLHDITELASLKGPVALAIGVFDGVHLGHQEVIRSAVDFAEKHGGTAAVMTFDPHPMRVLRPARAPRLLCSTRHKLHILEELGLTHTLVSTFSNEMAQMSAQTFVETLVSACQPLGYISVGYTWSFGKGREGNIHRLMELGQQHGFGVYGVPVVKLGDQVISSTLVREAVRNGDFSTARNLLGRDYTVLGEVMSGRQLGRTIGFPTANVAMENEELPPNGVYAVQARLKGQGPWTKGVANLGYKPTVGSDERSLEVHLFDFTADIYGEELEVAFTRHIREEKKFSGLDELKAQIAKDAAEARA